MRIIGLTIGLLLLASCGLFGGGTDPEGRNAGECSDGADNDGDGEFDCNDEDCEGSPDCEEEDTGPSDDSDTEADFALSFDPGVINVLLPLGYTTETLVDMTNDGTRVVVDDIRVVDARGLSAIEFGGALPFTVNGGDSVTLEFLVTAANSPDMTDAVLRVETNLGDEDLDVSIVAEPGN